MPSASRGALAKRLLSLAERRCSSAHSASMSRVACAGGRSRAISARKDGVVDACVGESAPRSTAPSEDGVGRGRLCASGGSPRVADGQRMPCDGLHPRAVDEDRRLVAPVRASRAAPAPASRRRGGPSRGARRSACRLQRLVERRSATQPSTRLALELGREVRACGLRRPEAGARFHDAEKDSAPRPARGGPRAAGVAGAPRADDRLASELARRRSGWPSSTSTRPRMPPRSTRRTRSTWTWGRRRTGCRRSTGRRACAASRRRRATRNSARSAATAPTRTSSSGGSRGR